MQLCSEDRTVSSLCSSVKGPQVSTGLRVLPVAVGRGDVAQSSLVPESLLVGTAAACLKVAFKVAKCLCEPVNRAGS